MKKQLNEYCIRKIIYSNINNDDELYLDHDNQHVFVEIENSLNFKKIEQCKNYIAIMHCNKITLFRLIEINTNEITTEFINNIKYFKIPIIKIYTFKNNVIRVDHNICDLKIKSKFKNPIIAMKHWLRL